MARRPVAAVLLAVLAVSLWEARPAAQKEFELYYAMVQMGEDLGVSCVYCHVAGPDKKVDYRSDANPRKLVARKMMDMTADINARVWLATGTEAARDRSVTCVSCHRGVPVPVSIATLVRRAVDTEGPEAAVASYRTLRGRFYERDVYDFTEAELLRIARSYSISNPDAALALARMNLDWHPQSAATYVVMAYAYTRKLDDRSAIPLLRKALELDPENGPARGYLYQLEQFQRSKPGEGPRETR